MTISEEKKVWTDEELLVLPSDGCKREIIDGELVMMSPAGFGHGSIISRLSGQLSKIVYSEQLGELADGQTGFRLAGGNLYCPDISFVSAHRVLQHRAQKSAFFHGAPDLVVEVLSPADTVENLHEKLDQFFKEGTRLAWVVNPKKQCIYIYHSPQSFQTAQANESLSGEGVIPGFTLPISFLFQ